MTRHSPQDQLAEQQRQLVDALTGRGEPPASFEASNLAIARTALLRKRMYPVAKSVPALATALQQRFEPLFREYASSFPIASEALSADARQFAMWVALRRDATGAPLRAAAAILLGPRTPVKRVRLGDRRAWLVRVSATRVWRWWW